MSRCRRPEGGRRLSKTEVSRIEQRREACRADIDDRTYCELRRPVETSGPVTAVTPTEFTRSVRKSLDAYGGMPVLRLACVRQSRCAAAFEIGGRRLEMAYRMEALKGSRSCWELVSFRVVRPVPDLGGFAAPLPNRGCVYD